MPSSSADEVDHRDDPFLIEIDAGKLGHYLDRARGTQDMVKGLVGGCIAGVGMAVLLTAAFLVPTGWRLELVPLLGLGFMVGDGVRVFGRGVARRFGVLGALITLTGALGAKATALGFTINMQMSDGGSAALEALLGLLGRGTDLVELAVLGLALGLAYYLSFRRITEAELATLAR